jgi:hypothetical protein
VLKKRGENEGEDMLKKRERIGMRIRMTMRQQEWGQG